MTLVANLTHFQVPTGAIGTTLDVAHGLGEAPKAMILWWNGRTEAVDTTSTANHRRGVGFAGSSPTTDRRCWGTASDDAVGNAVAVNANRNDCVVNLSSQAGAGRLDIQSVDATNVTFIVDQAFVIGFRAFALFIGGSDITIAQTGEFTSLTATGTQDVTVTGFESAETEDQVVFFLSGDGGTVNDVPQPSSTISFGVMAGNGTVEAVFAGWSADDNNPSTMITSSYCRRGECIAVPGTPSADVLNNRAEGSAWLTDGFRINWLEVQGVAGNIVHYLAIKGGVHKVGAITTSTTTGANVSSEALGFTPLGALLVSANAAEDAADTRHSHDRWSMGGFTTLSARGCHWIGDEDAAGTSDVYTDVQFDNVYIARLATTGVLEGEADIDVIADPFQLDMTDGDAAARFMWYWAFAGPPPPPTPPRPTIVLDAVRRAASW